MTIETKTGGAVSGNFASGAHRIVDASNGSYLTLYINATDTDVIGTAIPTSPENISGVFDEYSTTQQEIEPRGLYDFSQYTTPVPEPSTVLGGILLIGAAGWSQRRRLRALVTA